MFQNLSEKLVTSLRKIRGKTQMTEENISETLKEIKLNLLEADVNFLVVKKFIDRIKEKAVGKEVLESISAGEQVVKIVHDELVSILGEEKRPLVFRGDPAVIFLVGLQGTGKTTSSAKLAAHIEKQYSKRTALVSVDVYRPAAMEQLKTVAEANNLLCYPSEPKDKPKNIAKSVKSWAKENRAEVIIVDTAGRLQIDKDLMKELEMLKGILDPCETLLVADAMLGQQSVDVAKGFHELLSLTGLILTKVDGDARGGAALSIRETTGVPIKFLGVGEKTSQWEVFHPDRLASRILDMGDVVSLVEKAEELIDEKAASESLRKMSKNQFTLDDFLSQLRMMKKMGGLEGILKLLPGGGGMMKNMKKMAPPETEMKKIEAIILSMTPKERTFPRILNGSRRRRIALGSGTEVSDINKFIKQFETSQKMMKQFSKMGFKGGFPKMPF